MLISTTEMSMILSTLAKGRTLKGGVRWLFHLADHPGWYI